MKFKKYILTGTLALLLSSTGIATIEGNKADASSLDKYLTESQFHDKRIAEEYKKLTIMMNEYRAKAALKKNDFVSMADAKVALEKIYKEIDEIINR
nr:complement inhibitor SCIN family protein [Staphylococcus aureus]